MKYTRIRDTIFTVEDFLTRQECHEFMVLSEGIGYEAAKVNTTAGARVMTGIRNNKITGPSTKVKRKPVTSLS
jgi:hypothetical protein